MMQTRNDPQGGVRPWPTWVALAAVWCAVFIDLGWVYGLLLVAWGLYDLLTGESIFIQRITRRRQPVTYWLVISTWMLFGVLWITYEA